MDSVASRSPIYPEPPDHLEYVFQYLCKFSGLPSSILNDELSFNSMNNG